jgi:hypothetical protein
MKTRSKAVAALLAASGLIFSTGVGAHNVPNPDGHLPSDVNYGFNVIGRDTLAGITDGLYTDVWSHNGFAYVGTFQEPSCTRAGVFIVDIDAAVANYAEDENNISGAVVAEIASAPGTRVNDVKVHTITTNNKTRDVLILTEEKCGKTTPNGQQGKGGISLWDVTDPSKPHALKQHFLSSEIHNTFAWTADDGRSYLIAVDDLEINDVIVVDITKPQAPKTVAVTGIGDWLDGAYPTIEDDEQLFTGNFAAPLLHDVWVDKIDDQWQAVLSYWDAGFVTLNVDDPANPFVMGDSTYPDPDPVFETSPGEGNGHAAVFGGDEGQYIWAGDEDFDVYDSVLSVDGTQYATAVAGFGPDASGIAGDIVNTDGEGCTPAAIPLATNGGQIALIDRGACFFQDKADSAEAKGYAGYIVANNVDEPIFSMGARDGASVAIPGVMVSQADGITLKANGGTVEGLEQIFDGWGYYHVLNNLADGTTTLAPPSVPGESPEDREVLDIPYLGHMGYYAPIEATDPALATGAGDLTMHNVEGDPLTAGDTPTFDSGPRSFVSWYSAGMRAVEYRPGHYHTGNGGVESWNVHEVGQFIDEDGSNFWGVHVDERDGEQIILGSDRNTGLWIFTFTCETEVFDAAGDDTGLYCRREGN